MYIFYLLNRFRIDLTACLKPRIISCPVFLKTFTRREELDTLFHVRISDSILLRVRFISVKSVLYEKYTVRMIDQEGIT